MRVEVDRRLDWGGGQEGVAWTWGRVGDELWSFGWEFAGCEFYLHRMMVYKLGSIKFATQNNHHE